jgi:hypothetical protein
MATQTNSTQITKNTVNIGNLAREVQELKVEIAEAKQDFVNGIKEIKEKLLARPTWGVCLVITSLSSLVVGLSMFVLTKL